MESNRYILEVGKRWPSWPPVVAVALLLAASAILAWFGNSTLGALFLGTVLALQALWLREWWRALRFIRDENEHAVWLDPGGIRVRLHGSEELITYESIETIGPRTDSAADTPNVAVLSLSKPIGFHDMWGDINPPWDIRRLNLKTPEAPSLIAAIQARIATSPS